ncbi:hypothetical protein MXD58_027660, partial [Frankia sp. AgKG'84/4]|nr:hypothetical protein [Frankia sp. AgKG'84/4]
SAESAGSAAADEPAAVGATLAARSLALVTVVVVTARVLSPQYLVWLLALAAAGLAVSPRPAPAPGESPERTGRLIRGRGPAARERRLVVGLLAVALLSQVIYPWRYNDVIQGRIVLSVLLVVRNAGLLMVCWWAVRAAAGPRPAPPPR